MEYSSLPISQHRSLIACCDNCCVLIDCPIFQMFHVKHLFPSLSVASFFAIAGLRPRFRPFFGIGRTCRSKKHQVVIFFRATIARITPQSRKNLPTSLDFPNIAPRAALKPPRLRLTSRR